MVEATSGTHRHPPRAVAWASTAIVGWMRERVVEAGGDPKMVPEEDFRFLRLRDVEARVGLRRSSIYRRIGAKQFPAPVLLGEAEGRAG